ncbi:M23 family metallopeptidase [Arsenicicoccus bolidensis]|uniref:Peptidoglycan DD-metalloendopeptidase family protein n=4 Tax=Intrasporangiaceae TaxID=85021 RepID=A0ABS9Q3L7_9MICO|nr:M23 family metallopeptidase [Arsenicicoccus bolidensis]MCG7322473.1 peptidoglycan DD-metalloendopeptidase family protein [Arsenicicoccus bolidensis]
MSVLHRGRLHRGSVALTCALAAALPVLPSVLVAAPAHAAQVRGDSDDDLRDRQSALERGMGTLRGTLEVTSSALADAYAELVTAERQLPGARAAEAAATSALEAARRRDAELAAQLEQARADETTARDDLARTRASMVSATEAIGQVASEMQDPGAELRDLSLLVEAQTPDDLYTRYSVLEAVGSVRASAARDLATVRAAETAKQARLEAVRARVAELKTESADNVRGRENAQAAAAAARTRVEQLVATTARAKAAVEARKADETARLAQLDREADAVRTELADRAARARAAAAAEAAERARRAATDADRARQAADAARRGRPAPPPVEAPAANPAPGGGILGRPATGGITSPYGMRQHPVLHVYKLHTGTDFSTGCGAPIYAAADGRIISAGFNTGYGNRIMVEHGTVRGRDLVTTYNHLTSFAVQGGAVRKGQLLGYSGTTGYSTGCHLHFETIVDGRFTNPMEWL